MLNFKPNGGINEFRNNLLILQNKMDGFKKALAYI